MYTYIKSYTTLLTVGQLIQDYSILIRCLKFEGKRIWWSQKVLHYKLCSYGVSFMLYCVNRITWNLKSELTSLWEFLHSLLLFPFLWKIWFRELKRTKLLHHMGACGAKSWQHKPRRWKAQREVLGGQGGFWWWIEGVALEEDPTMGLEDVWEHWRALCQIVTLWGWMDSSDKLLITYCLYKREWESCRLWLRYWQALTSDWFVCVKTN